MEYISGAYIGYVDYGTVIKDRDTVENIFNFFKDSIDYFSLLKLEMLGKPIIERKLKTGFLGFVIDMLNLKNLYCDYRGDYIVKPVI